MFEGEGNRLYTCVRGVVRASGAVCEGGQAGQVLGPDQWHCEGPVVSDSVL